MDLNPIILSIPLYFLLILIEWIYDGISKKGIYRLNDAFGNISCGIFEQITGVFFKVFTIGMYTLVYSQFRLMDIPTTLPYLLLMWIAIDFAYYWAHRWSHTVNLFWLGHVVHHQSEDYNFSVALRQGALQKVFTFWVYLPLALLGFDPYWFVFIGALNTVYQFWIHTEQIGKLGWFEKIFNTPSHHRVHHGRNPKYIDKNHAGSLIIWDKLFGTFQEEEETPVYGITLPNQHWDPVSSHVQPFVDLYHQIRGIKGIGNKVLMLAQAPGWRPKDQGGRSYATEVRKESYTKFNTRVPRSWAIYLFIHFLITLGATAYFLFTFEQNTLLQNLYWAAGITFSVISLGLIFELRSWAWILELIRLAALFILLLFPFSGWIGWIGMVIILASAFILVKNRHALQRE
jgi:alkylglycerol monooxygenase